MCYRSSSRTSHYRLKIRPMPNSSVMLPRLQVIQTAQIDGVRSRNRAPLQPHRSQDLLSGSRRIGHGLLWELPARLFYRIFCNEGIHGWDHVWSYPLQFCWVVVVENGGIPFCAIAADFVVRGVDEEPRFHAGGSELGGELLCGLRMAEKRTKN